MTREELFPVYEDAFNLLCGVKIGEGMTRTVYTTEMRPNCVIKVETDASSHFQNIIEWEVWNAVDNTEHAKWFAPCLWISPNGKVMVQRRTEVLHRDAYPKQLPVFLTDLKLSNFGSLNGRFVCHDYGLSAVMVTSCLSTKMRAVRWPR